MLNLAQALVNNLLKSAVLAQDQGQESSAEWRMAEEGGWFQSCGGRLLVTDLIGSCPANDRAYSAISPIMMQKTGMAAPYLVSKCSGLRGTPVLSSVADVPPTSDDPWTSGSQPAP